MALVKCKECSEEVSTSAKACPKCGAKVPKKTSLFTWLVVLLIIFILYSANQNRSSDKSLKINTGIATQNNESLEVETPSQPTWTTSISTDEMTGKFSAHATSPTAYPTKKMSFPYHNVYSWIGIGCDKNSQWVYFGFNSAPNLTKDQTKDGYSLTKTRIKWNNSVENVSLTQDWGSKFIHFENYSAAISKIAASNTALLELQWHGEQPTFFEFSLKGSSKAFAEIKSRCAQGK
ncbi:MAG: zinc ribbon domain-containing protein [Pseudomonadota bacterium]